MTFDEIRAFHGAGNELVTRQPYLFNEPPKHWMTQGFRPDHSDATASDWVTIKYAMASSKMHGKPSHG